MPRTWVRDGAEAYLHRYLPLVSPSQRGFVCPWWLVPLEVDVRAPGASTEKIVFQYPAVFAAQPETERVAISVITDSADIAFPARS